jgi:class 3 adenylate cyclase
LVLQNGFAAGPAIGAPTEQLEELADRTRAAWGSGRVLAAAVPHFADDPAFCARFERMGARPSAAAALVRNLASTDVRPLLDKITAPTLVAYSGDITSSTVEDSRELARQIPNARLFEGASSTFYWGGGAIEAIVGFIAGATSVGDRDLVTLLFTDVVDSTRAVVAAGDDEWRQTLNFLDDLVAARVSRAGGRVVKQTGDGHLIEFARPGDAVRAAIAICRAAPTLGVTLRAGVHTGEIERRENGDIGGLSVHIAARVAAVAGPGQVVVSRTVADLLGAAEHGLRDCGEHELKGVPGRWALFAVDA